jgi:hypothetical protein
LEVTINKCIGELAVKNWKTHVGCEETAKALLRGVQIGLGPKPQKESNALRMFPNAVRCL